MRILKNAQQSSCMLGEAAAMQQNGKKGAYVYEKAKSAAGVPKCSPAHGFFSVQAPHCKKVWLMIPKQK
jgi:hypothetical protein